MKATRALAILMLGILGCGGDPDPNSTSASTSSSGAGGMGQGGAGGAGGSGGQGGNGGNGGAGGSSAIDVPATPPELFTFLQSKGYAGFAAESAPHPSTGPHGGPVRTFINEPLRLSLEAGSAEHPKGAACVKELYDTAGTTLRGWAVFVKTEDASAGGQGFYWYEHFSTTSGENPAFAGQGLALCANCHVGGKDYFLTPFPLQ